METHNGKKYALTQAAIVAVHATGQEGARWHGGRQEWVFTLKLCCCIAVCCELPVYEVQLTYD